MDLKAFKQDVIYCCKSIQKDGKRLCVAIDNLDVVGGKFVPDGNSIHPFEMLILIREYMPPFDWQVGGYNIPVFGIVSEQAEINIDDLYAFSDGFENVEVPQECRITSAAKKVSCKLCKCSFTTVMRDKLFCSDNCFNNRNPYYGFGVLMRGKFKPFDARPDVAIA